MLILRASPGRNIRPIKTAFAKMDSGPLNSGIRLRVLSVMVPDREGITILTRRGKAPLIIVNADLALRMLHVVDQMNRFLSDPAIAHLVQITGLFSGSLSALDHSALKKPDWLPAALAELRALAEGE